MIARFSRVAGRVVGWYHLAGSRPFSGFVRSGPGPDLLTGLHIDRGGFNAMKYAALLSCLLTLVVPGQIEATEPARAGEYVHQVFQTPHPYPTSGTDEPVLTWVDEVVFPGCNVHLVALCPSRPRRRRFRRRALARPLAEVDLRASGAQGIGGRRRRVSTPPTSGAPTPSSSCTRQVTSTPTAISSTTSGGATTTTRSR